MVCPGSLLESLWVDSSDKVTNRSIHPSAKSSSYLKYQETLFCKLFILTFLKLNWVVLAHKYCKLSRSITILKGWARWGPSS